MFIKYLNWLSSCADVPEWSNGMDSKSIDLVSSQVQALPSALFLKTDYKSNNMFLMRIFVLFSYTGTKSLLIDNG